MLFKSAYTRQPNPKANTDKRLLDWRHNGKSSENIRND